VSASSLEALDEPEYLAFLEQFKERPGVALSYHYPYYLRFLSRQAYPGSSIRMVHSRDGEGRLTGVLPALHLRNDSLNVWLSLAYYGPNAGALTSQDDPETVLSLLEGALRDAEDLNCDSMAVYSPLWADPDLYLQGLASPDFTLERRSQALDLNSYERIETDGETVGSVWPKKVRYDIRRAQRNGVMVRKIESEQELERVWEIYSEHSLEVGIPVKPFDHLLALYNDAGDAGIFLCSEHEQQIVAGLVCLMGGGVLSYYLPCTRREARHLQPGLLLLDRAVDLAVSSGCRLLNFESSPGDESPTYQFKSRSGGVPIPYYVFVKLLRPDALTRYRQLGRNILKVAAPQAFIIPFEALD
jgi:hypothetical protein